MQAYARRPVAVIRGDRNFVFLCHLARRSWIVAKLLHLLGRKEHHADYGIPVDSFPA
jgi:hypothetical protein